MNVAADLQHVRSLDAMSRALRASRSPAQILVEIRTSVVRDMLNARYYDSPQGQFISQDPIFLSSSQNLTDPQSLNAYSYSEDNPITKSDPAGKQCIECAGGEVALSLSAQGAYDKVFGPSNSAVYGGDTVAAAIYGFAYPCTLVAPEPIAAVSAAAGNITQQGLEYLSGDRNSYDPLQSQTAATVAFGSQLVLGELPLPFISASPLTKQIATKLENGSISNVSNATLGNIVTSGAPADFAGNFATSYIQSHVNVGNINDFQNYESVASMALSTASPSLSLTISLAQATIELAQTVIAAHSSGHSR